VGGHESHQNVGGEISRGRGPIGCRCGGAHSAHEGQANFNFSFSANKPSPAPPWAGLFSVHLLGRYRAFQRFVEATRGCPIERVRVEMISPRAAYVTAQAVEMSGLGAPCARRRPNLRAASRFWTTLPEAITSLKGGCTIAHRKASPCTTCFLVPRPSRMCLNFVARLLLEAGESFSMMSGFRRGDESDFSLRAGPARIPKHKSQRTWLDESRCFTASSLMASHST